MGITTSKIGKLWKRWLTLRPRPVSQTTEKVTQLYLDGPKELSRRELEEIEKQKAKAHSTKVHLTGKTEQARADLAGLANIREHLEEEARKKGEQKMPRLCQEYECSRSS